MIRIDGLAVKNLRSLKDSGIVNLKPINILVGKNSAGKSTFARLLPLLKQSSERSKPSPVLWYGRLVDFGAFDDVYCSYSTDGFIDITVRFAVDQMVFLMRRPFFRYEDTPIPESGHITATFRLGKDGDDGKTVLKELQLKVYEIDVHLTMASSHVTSVSVNRRSIEIPSNIRIAWTQGQLLPLIRSVNLAPAPQASVSDESLFMPRRISRFGVSLARSAVSAFVHGNTQESRKEEIVDRLPIVPRAEFLKVCQALPGTTETWKTLIAQASVSSNALQRLHEATIIYKLDMLLQKLDEVAQTHLADVNYLEPLRATAQRYYRREELSTDELDPKGLNTPFYIQGLTNRERDSLQSWTIENFGFSLSVKNTGGHLSLNILPTSEGAISRNMADVGLGYSQLVPVAVQLWAAKHRTSARVARRTASASRGSSERFSPTVVIEQPELHLHPAYQARLADVFATAIAPRPDKSMALDSSLTIVAETHSPNLISRLGELINSGALSADAVQILVFENSSQDSGGTNIRVATYDQEGILKNWPIGFFDS